MRRGLEGIKDRKGRAGEVRVTNDAERRTGEVKWDGADMAVDGSAGCSDLWKRRSKQREEVVSAGVPLGSVGWATTVY